MKNNSRTRSSLEERHIESILGESLKNPVLQLKSTKSHRNY